jgi:hypothetical protein
MTNDILERHYESINRLKLLKENHKIHSLLQLIWALITNNIFKLEWIQIWKEIISNEEDDITIATFGSVLKAILAEIGFPTRSWAFMLPIVAVLRIAGNIKIMIFNVICTVRRAAIFSLTGAMGISAIFKSKIHSSDNIVIHDKLSYEEYQLYYESAERVTDRRLEMNRYNYSICTAILIALTFLLQWAIKNSNYFLFSLPFIIFLSLIAIFYCILWIGQLLSFKNLNNVKFDILNRMAPNVFFSPSSFDNRISYQPFEKEWKELEKKKNALEKLRIKSDINALKSSNAEFAIPHAFIILFSLIIVIGVIFFILYAKGMITIYPIS